MKRMHFLTLIIVLSLVLTHKVQAQEVQQDKSKVGTKTIEKETVNNTEGTSTVGDKIKIIGTNNSAILEIEEETNGAASIIINDKSNFGSNKKLLNDNGNLMWGTEQLATGSGGGTTYAVGDFAQGGIVFWVDATGEHGLVCAKEDQNGGTSTTRWFAGTHGSTQALGNGPFSGKMNTSIIISSHVAIGDDGNTYAARICAELEITEGGKTYGDWYLPSIGELKLMFQNKAVIETTANANGGANFQTNNNYWSSTESSSSYAHQQAFFGTGNIPAENKSNGNYVRAVRAF